MGLEMAQLESAAAQLGVPNHASQRGDASVAKLLQI
jgi:hypothetical protein